eukprot:Nk52_evm19s554 gene=Nk52_evmTU19s554
MVNSNIVLESNPATEEAQVLRREMSKGKKMVFVSCPYAASPVMHTYARDVLGVDLYIMAPAGDEFSTKLVKDGVCVAHIEADTGCSDAIEKCVEAIKNYGVEFDGVFSMHEIAIPLVCGITDALNMPGNSALAAANARNKHRAREICRENNLNSPRFASINSRDDIAKAAEHVKFPSVVKPSSGAGSEGVIRVDDINELYGCYDRILNDMQVCESLNWNPGQGETFMVLEQYLLGDEFDVDCLFWEGEPVYTTVTDNWPTFEPYFLETGSSCPTKYGEEVQKEIIDYVVSVVKALGFKQGAFHVECKYGSDGPQLIEVNPRMGGGPVNEFQTSVWGVNLFENFVLSALGIPINPPRSEKPLVYTSHYSLNAPVSGVLTNNQFCDFMKKNEKVAWVHYIAEAGKEVKGLDKGLPDWVAEFRVNGDSVEDSINLVEELVSQVEYPIMPKELHQKQLEVGEIRRRRRSSATEFI